MKISQIIKIPTVRIILCLYEKGELRHSQLSKLTASRGTLSLSLKELEQDSLIQRKILDTKPIQSIYSLTEKGKTIAQQLNQIQQDIK
ncbi:MAG: winged helix-turn-helix transcriptional regulator [Candidatus Bathyarchaeia archaeon]